MPNNRNRSTTGFARLDREKLKEGARELQALTSSLDKRLRAVESWMASLEGRVEVTIIAASPVKPEALQFGLRLKAPAWKLSYASFPTGRQPQELDWRPLTSAGLNAKLAAVDVLPDLLEALLEAQSTLLRRIQRADGKLAEMSESLGVPAAGGA